jgi:hypothetical protein
MPASVEHRAWSIMFTTLTLTANLLCIWSAEAASNDLVSGA